MTIKATGDPKLDERLRTLRAALRKLGGTEGRAVARRNARKHVLGALRALRADVDGRWPAIVSRAGVKRLTFEGRVARLTRAGWVEPDSTLDVARYAHAGVPIRVVRGASENITLVPGWAVAIGPDNPSRLRAAKRSNMEKHAALAAEALRST